MYKVINGYTLTSLMGPYLGHGTNIIGAAIWRKNANDEGQLLTVSLSMYHVVDIDVTTQLKVVCQRIVVQPDNVAFQQ
ncbi:Uncharacterised protein [Yersinia intermedia]|uniref:Uncharacterized protein n=1 Tax=Yersinia intermedia TaxID=631 RepID=A0A0H5LXT3_YERIN|nr:Uncharacterised protein [Yersinia intermedia]